MEAPEPQTLWGFLFSATIEAPFARDVKIILGT
jgi:hypothetical protein